MRPSAPYDEQGRAYIERSCPECGHSFWTVTGRRKWCTRRCQMRSWRAASLLAGTHDWRKRGTGHHEWTLQRVSAPREDRDPREVIWRSVSEKRWRGQVLAWATRGGWRAYFTWQSIHSPSGFPDLIMAKGERCIAAELKSERGKTTTAQDEWLAALQACDIEVFVWRPHDEGQVRRVLLEGALE